MTGELRQPVVFISAVTSELGPSREALAKLAEEHGAKVVAQHPFPNSLSDGLAIQRAIDQADVVVCLIGHAYGAELAKGKLPPEARPGCSWAQWEYLYARKYAKELRLFFYDGPKAAKAEPKKLADRQAKFRKQIEKEEMGQFGGKFFRRFDTIDKLVTDVVQYLQNMDGILARFQMGTWSVLRAKYRRSIVEAWQRDFTNVYQGKRETSATEKDRLMHAATAPFIASQRFSILEPKNGRQLHALRPAAFLPGRSTEIEAAARERATWNPVPRAALRQALLNGKDESLELGGVAIPHPTRLFLISGGGVGKTTNMRWLEWTINAADNSGRVQSPASAGADAEQARETPLADGADLVDMLALRVNAGAILNMDDAQVLQHLTQWIAGQVGEAASKWSRESITRGLLQDLSAQRLVILVDGLDHVETRKVPFLLSIQSSAPGRIWTRCTVVAAGRPNAIQGWADGAAASEDQVALSRWRFVEPSEFDPDEAEVFLGFAESNSRHALVATQLGQLARVPRVLEYVRTLPGSQLLDVRTSADIYQRALRELIKRTLKAGGKTPRMIGPRWQEDCEFDDPPGRQVQYIMKFMSVLAFLSLCPTTDDDFAERRTEAFKMSISDDVRRFIRERLVEEGRYDEANLDRDFKALAGFSAILGNGVLDATDSDDENFNSLVWSNRTIQQFLAAYWLAVHARGFDVFRQRLEGKISDIPPEDPARDTERLRHYVFQPEDTGADTTYEFNMFLAEMPPATPLNPSSWVASASVWYDPYLHRDAADGGAWARKWSSEMLYRSWATMHDIAGYPFDDWWDASYDSLTQNPPGKARAAASVHRTRDTTGLRDNPAARRAARAVLDRFYGDFETMLKGTRGAERQAAAQEMIAAGNWITVPAGELTMGAPLSKQGFPPKVRAYWLRDLETVQTKTMSAEAVARRSTKQEWFTGAQGKSLREDDIVWLTETFAYVEPPPDAPPMKMPNRNAPEFQNALQILEDKWSRRDETPAENPQHIASFVMHQMPVLHRWFHLFAPGHRATVTGYLAPVPHPPADHPAIYISWFDAWAFCQWATWTEEDAAAPGGRRRLGLRLPHEPEWEHAARWVGNRSAPEPIPYGQRYWWGDDFYQHEDSPEPEPLSNALAHTIGAPGGTRAPRDAAPNGLGFRDILGNVWEWTANVYDMQKQKEGVYTRTFPGQPSDRPPANCQRTMRGGLWYYLDLLANCTARFRLSSDDRDYKMSFRVVREERPPP